jgi:hypothetical protein
MTIHEFSRRISQRPARRDLLAAVAKLREIEDPRRLTALVQGIDGWYLWVADSAAEPSAPPA